MEPFTFCRERVTRGEGHGDKDVEFWARCAIRAPVRQGGIAVAIGGAGRTAQLDFMTKEFEVQGFYSLPDFVVLGRAYGFDESGVVRLIDEFRRKVPIVEEYVRGAFLSADAQTEYLRLFHDRLNMFRG